MSTCKCGAKWRTNFPHGIKSDSIRNYIVKHASNCPHEHNKKNRLDDATLKIMSRMRKKRDKHK